MVQRTGVGATIAAATLFSILLFSSLILLSASANQEMLASEANEVGLLNDVAQISAATYGLHLLDQMQGLLGSRAWQCSSVMSSVPEAVSSFVGSDNQVQGSIQGNAMLEQGTRLVDDNPMDYPFNGSEPGYATIELNLQTSETGAGGVSYHAQQHEVLSLPALLSSSVSLCESAFPAVMAYLSNSATDCEEKLMKPEVSDAVAPLEEEASSLGLRLTISSSLSKGPECLLRVTAAVSQGDVHGPEGTFTVRVEQEEELSIQPLNS